MKIGAAQKQAGCVAALVRLELPEPPPKTARSRRVSFRFTLDKEKLRAVRRREGRYLLRSNLTATDPAELWRSYLQLVEIEAAFKNLKSELAIRPIFHQREDRIEAHIFVAFLAYCVQVTFRQQLKAHAPGSPCARRWTSCRPCRCSTCTSRPPTGAHDLCPRRNVDRARREPEADQIDPHRDVGCRVPRAVCLLWQQWFRL